MQGSKASKIVDQVMSENVSLNGEALTDKNTGENAGEVVAGLNIVNQMEENSPSIETETSEINTNEVVSGYNNVERTEDAVQNDIGDSHFESRVASSVSLSSDSTEKSHATADEGKVEDNSPASASCKTDTVANAENVEEGQNGMPAPEENPFLQSVKYLEKHQILRLFQVRFVLRIINSSWHSKYNRQSLAILF